MIPLIIMLVSNGFTVTDSIVPRNSLDIDFVTNKHMTILYSYEIEQEEHPQNSIRFSGGSFLISDSSFDEMMWGFGVDAEFRRYKVEELTGFFISGIAGASLKYPSIGDMIESIRTGIKFGWKFNLKENGVQIDLEPSFGIGLMMDNAEAIGWEFDPDAYLGFGFGVAIH